MRSEIQGTELLNPLSAHRNLWILGPKRDLIFFILTPLFIIPLIFAVKDRLPLETLGICVLGFGGFGHHLPGFIRAYSDRNLFKQYKLRFTVIPLLLILVCGFYSFLNLNALICATVAWGTWHGAMQINGFMRIYDSKVKSFRPVTARLDWLMCLTWFGLAILHSPAKQFSLVTQFYASGGFLIPPHAFILFRQFWGVSTLLITCLFLINLFQQWKAGHSPSPVKLLTLASSFAFWWFCTVTLNNLLLGVIMWEIFHDVQYDVLVWLFQRQRVDKSLNVSPVEKMLFLPGWERLACYSVLVLAYGYIGVVTSFGDLNMPEKFMLANGSTQWIFRVTLASALLHFYYDGFIWRIREKSIRQGLGVQDEQVQSAETRRGSFAWHGWKWAFFIIPVGYLGFAQHRGWTANFESQMLNLTKAIPDSWLAHFFTGTSYSERGLLDSAEVHYGLAIKYKPDFAVGHLFLGDILYKKGDLREAAEHYQRSVDLDPSDMVGRKSLAFLYLKLDQPFLATGQFQAALKSEPENPDLTFGMASSLLKQNRIEEAEEYAKKTLQLSPNHSGVLNYLGMIQDARGNASIATAYYQKALALDSTNASARQNLSDAKVKSGF